MRLLNLKLVINMMYLIFSGLLFVLDQISKILTTIKLYEYESYTVIEGILSFTRYHNTGGPWSIFDNLPILFIIATLCIFAFEIFYFKKHPITHSLAKLSCALINAGAVGNLTDRIFRGYVVDMIEVTFIDYPVFNFADCYVVVGAVLFCVYVIFIDGKDKKPEVK